MYQDKEKSQKVYVESNCVSRDDCCWDETPGLITEVVAVEKKIRNQRMASALADTIIMWPVTDEEQDWLSKK